MDDEYVILVDGNDKTTGVMEKMEAHRKGFLHRAFSVFIFSHQGELMLQQRSFSKYHSPGLWTNTCCSHPRIDEENLTAAHRRMKEEMGFDCDLDEAFSFTYKAEVGNGLIEHEFDHVFIGKYDKAPVINPEEATNWRFASMSELKKDILTYPENYTVWFRIALSEVENYFGRLK
jgi:isopentenyl-diphosphate Delta-isomerase